MTKTIYRPRGGSETKVVSVSLSRDTLSGLDLIRQAFFSKFPSHSQPSISAVFETVLTKAAAELNSDPDWLAMEVKDFQTRYLQARRK